jgi:uncharacterized protein DUF397
MPPFLPTYGDLAWRVSRRCESGACIKVARNGDAVIFGNTNDPDGTFSVYSWAEWKEFLAGARQGEFDDLL